MKKTLALAAVAAFGLVGAANADVISIDMSGTTTAGGWLAPGNPSWSYTLGAGTEITEVEYVDVEIFAGGTAWASDFTMSVNDYDGNTLGDYWDVGLDGAPGEGGSYGPVSGTFSGTGGFGGPFTLGTDELYVELNGWADIEVISGTLNIHYNAVPAPGALALLGVAGVVGARRRRRA